MDLPHMPEELWRACLCDVDALTWMQTMPTAKSTDSRRDGFFAGLLQVIRDQLAHFKKRVPIATPLTMPALAAAAVHCVRCQGGREMPVAPALVTALLRVKSDPTEHAPAVASVLEAIISRTDPHSSYTLRMWEYTRGRHFVSIGQVNGLSLDMIRVGYNGQGFVSEISIGYGGTTPNVLSIESVTFTIVDSHVDARVLSRLKQNTHDPLAQLNDIITVLRSGHVHGEETSRLAVALIMLRVMFHIPGLLNCHEVARFSPELSDGLPSVSRPLYRSMTNETDVKMLLERVLTSCVSLNEVSYIVDAVGSINFQSLFQTHVYLEKTMLPQSISACFKTLLAPPWVCTRVNDRMLRFDNSSIKNLGGVFWIEFRVVREDILQVRGQMGSLFHPIVVDIQTWLDIHCSAPDFGLSQIKNRIAELLAARDNLPLTMELIATVFYDTLRSFYAYKINEDNYWTAVSPLRQVLLMMVFVGYPPVIGERCVIGTSAFSREVRGTKPIEFNG